MQGKLLVMPTPRFANLQAILAEESEPETGVVSKRAEERLEAEMCRVLIDFFERFFLWMSPEKIAPVGAVVF